jgi:hypothetical protein
MMTRNNLSITVELEPIVKLACNAIDCKHNLARREGGRNCNLKHVVLSADGVCLEHTPWDWKNEKPVEKQ